MKKKPPEATFEINFSVLSKQTAYHAFNAPVHRFVENHEVQWFLYELSRTRQRQACRSQEI